LFDQSLKDFDSVGSNRTSASHTSKLVWHPEPGPSERLAVLPRPLLEIREICEYHPATRTWAKLLHDHIRGLEGLAWRPRLASQGEAYVFPGDGCGAADFAIVTAPTPLTSPTEYGKIKAVVDSANIAMLHSK